MKKIFLLGIFTLVFSALSAGEMVFWHYMTIFQGKEMTKLITKYNREQRGRSGFIKIKEVNHPGEAGVFKIKQVGRGTDAPDIILVPTEMIYYFIKSYKVIKLDSYLNADSGLKKDIPRIMRSIGSKIGSSEKELYGLPFNVSTLVIYYNQTRLRQIGIRKPIKRWTWDQMLGIARKLTKGKKYGICWFARPYYFLPLVWSHNSDFFAVNLKDPKIYKRNLEALQTWADLFRKHKVMPSNLTLKEAYQQFLSGNIAMGPETCAGLRFGRDSSPYRVGIAPMPSIKTTRTYIGGGVMCMVNKKGMSADRKKSAWNFMTWMINKQNTIQWHKGTGYIPVRNSALKSAELRSFHQQNPQFKVAVGQLRYALAPNVRYNVLKLQDVFVQNLSAMMNDKTLDAKTVLDRLIKEIEQAKY